MVSGWGKRTKAVLPVISVAEPSEIQALLSSVLYQWFVWGIQAPAVGISLSATGTIVRAILGWVDPLLSPLEGLVSPLDTLKSKYLITPFPL